VRREAPSGLESTVHAGEGGDAPPLRYRPVTTGSRLGRYELTGELGTGGMATVYRARDSELRREVAVKVLFAHLCKKREVVARFQREARAAAALDHRHILRVLDVGGGPSALRPGTADDDAEEMIDPPFIVLELVRGHSLRAHMEQRRGPILAEVVACAGAVICEALEVAHAAGIVHRDIKPANIMVANGGRLVLADFGVARLDDDDSSLVTRTGAILGTPAFMSPEQAQGDSVTERSDVYSLGATLYQLATGSMPFGGPTPKMMWAIAHGEQTPPLRRNPAMGTALAGAIEHMMTADPAARAATARAAGGALREAAAAGGITEVEQTLADYFADPEGFEANQRPVIVAHLLESARTAAATGQLPRATSLADRVLGLDPDNADALALVDGMTARARSRRLVTGGAVLLALAGAATAAYLLWPAPAAALPRPDAAPADAAPALDGDTHVGPNIPVSQRISHKTSNPETHRTAHPPALDGDTHVGPSILESQRISHKTSNPETHRTAHPPVPPTAPPIDAAAGQGGTAPPAPPDAAPAPPPSAWLTLDISPWCNARIDGVDVGRANRARRIELRPGRHEVICSQGPGMGEWRRTVTLTPGQHLTETGSVLRPVAVAIAVSGGDGVRISGHYHANGSHLTLSPDRYRIELMKGGQATAGRWVTLPRVRSCVVRDRPALDCYAPKP